MTTDERLDKLEAAVSFLLVVAASGQSLTAEGMEEYARHVYNMDSTLRAEMDAAGIKPPPER